MSKRQLIRAALILVGLIVLWGGFEIVRRAGADEAKPFALPALAAPDVDTVAMMRGPDTILLVRRDGARWAVNGMPAASAEVTSLFDALRDTAKSDLVARSATSHVRLGVDSAGGRHVRFMGGGKVLLDLVVGNRGREWGTIYVRRSGESDVYVVGGLANVLDRGLEAWRDKQIATVPTDSITEIEVERGASSYTLQHADSAWTVDGAPADSTAVGRLLQELREVTATGFPTKAQMDSVDFAKPDRRLVVHAAAGRTLLALSFDSTAYAYWVRHDSGGTVFRLDSWRADRLMPTDSALKAR